MRRCAFIIPFILTSVVLCEEQPEKSKLRRIEHVTAPAPSDKWKKKVVDTQEMERPLNQFLDYLASVSGVNILADSDTLQKEFKKLTVKVPAMNQVTWYTLLQMACEQHGLRIDEQQLNANIIVLWQPARVTINVRDAVLRDVIWSIANQAKLNVIVDAEVKGTVTASLINVPWDTALNSVLKSTGFMLTRDRNGSWRVAR
jgi:type II secretory pathway component HofQ